MLVLELRESSTKVLMESMGSAEIPRAARTDGLVESEARRLPKDPPKPPVGSFPVALEPGLPVKLGEDAERPEPGFAGVWAVTPVIAWFGEAPAGDDVPG